MINPKPKEPKNFGGNFLFALKTSSQKHNNLGCGDLGEDRRDCMFTHDSRRDPEFIFALALDSRLDRIRASSTGNVFQLVKCDDRVGMDEAEWHTHAQLKRNSRFN